MKPQDESKRLKILHNCFGEVAFCGTAGQNFAQDAVEHIIPANEVYGLGRRLQPPNADCVQITACFFWKVLSIYSLRLFLSVQWSLHADNSQRHLFRVGLDLFPRVMSPPLDISCMCFLFCSFALYGPCRDSGSLPFVFGVLMWQFKLHLLMSAALSAT